jgi:hypothetical protein
MYLNNNLCRMLTRRLQLHRRVKLIDLVLKKV